MARAIRAMRWERNQGVAHHQHGPESYPIVALRYTFIWDDHSWWRPVPAQAPACIACGKTEFDG